MLDTNVNLQDLRHKLMKTTEPYEALYQRVHDTEFGDILSTIMLRRKENIAELGEFISAEGIVPETDAETSAPIVSSPDDVVSTERDILDAYDKAIVPLTGRHEKYGFLVDQYEWLKETVENLAVDTA